MYKYLLFTFGFTFIATAQQADLTYYAAPYLQIEKANQMVDLGTKDFGYNVLLHKENPFIKEGYYMWVDNQWYEITNAKDVFTAYNDFKTLFTISKTHQNPLKIKDVNDVIYLYPIEALDAYKVSHQDFTALSKVIEKKELVTYEQPKAVIKEEIKEPVIVLKEEVDAKTIELPKLNPAKEEEVLITSENPSSVLLDVLDIVEVVKREEVPFSSTKTSTNENVAIEEVVPVIEPVETVKISASNTLIIPKPANAYEVAVNEGFDGTVTEWIEMIDAQGGKSAYEQAVSSGYVGSEDEWLKMLWGREVDVEVAKKDKTTAIVSEWIQSLQTTKGNAPYEMALKHGFYGTYTEWVESVIGSDGEKAYEHAISKGFEGTYKEWIEKQLNASNQELLRKERLTKTQLFVAPNVVMPLLTDDTSQPLQFDLYAYYNQYYGAPMISSDGQKTNALEILPTDLEYQITWFEKDKIKIIGLTKEGVITYTPLEGVTEVTTRLNIRYILK
ncbi:MAG TPA: hypothetical protein VLY87_00940 [Flavobacterium sp.]|nr:hypothetical protein [Flavobacterium sp.]